MNQIFTLQRLVSYLMLFAHMLLILHLQHVPLHVVFVSIEEKNENGFVTHYFEMVFQVLQP